MDATKTQQHSNLADKSVDVISSCKTNIVVNGDDLPPDPSLNDKKQDSRTNTQQNVIGNSPCEEQNICSSKFATTIGMANKTIQRKDGVTKLQDMLHNGDHTADVKSDLCSNNVIVEKEDDNDIALNSGTSGSPVLSIESVTSLPKANKPFQQSLDTTSTKKKALEKKSQPIVIVPISISSKVFPATYPNGPLRRKSTNEKFFVKQVQHSDSSGKASGGKTKLRPVFGHASVRNLINDRGPFPVIYIGAPNITDMQAYRKMMQKEAEEQKNISSINNAVPTASDSLSLVSSNHLIQDNDKNNIKDDSAMVNEHSNGDYNIREMMNSFLKTEESFETSPSYSSPSFYNSEMDSLPSMVYAQKGMQGDAVNYAMNHVQKKYTVPLSSKRIKTLPSLWPGDKHLQVTLPEKTLPGPLTYVPLSLTLASSYTSKPITVHVPASGSTCVQKSGNSATSVSISKLENTVSTAVKSIVSTVTIPTVAPVTQNKQPFILPANFKVKTVIPATFITTSVNSPPISVVKGVTKAATAPINEKCSDSETVQKSNKQNLDVGKEISSIDKSSPFNTYVTTPSSSVASFPRRPGALVQFEDGEQLWIDKLRHITYMDDEPVTSWKLSRGTKVAARFTDGLVYDAVIMSSYDGTPALSKSSTTVKTNEETLPTTKSESSASTTVSSKPSMQTPTSASMKTIQIPKLKPVMTNFKPVSVQIARKEETKQNKRKFEKIDEKKIPRVKIKKLDLDEKTTTYNSKTLEEYSSRSDSSKESENEDKKSKNDFTLKIKCPDCFLIFGNSMLFKKHQKTVCGSAGITIAGLGSSDPNPAVKVDESSCPPMVGKLQKQIKSQPDGGRLFPRAPDGKRWFRRGTHILHRWQTDAGGSKWYNGKILRLLDSSKGLKCEFEVEYTDDDHDKGPYAVALYEDFPHDIRIVTR
ncbi:unnamed protein product [Clavelina lepadiformis]|uniref:C2H2-type domain-containing protein n=1 Tax=Clavelina lepadiformis TaxID=159417 RepID=A0ABP0F8H9_CLALP